jgi:hypothetical protein
MREELTLDAFIQRLKSKPLTDKRTGQNVQYEVNDAAQAAFAIFFAHFWPGNAICAKPKAGVTRKPSLKWHAFRRTPIFVTC